MPENDNGTTYSFNVCGQCKSICCQNAKPPLSEKRKKIITKHIQKQKVNFKTLFHKERYSYPAVDEEVYCLLFNKKTGKCMVHPVKPETCVSGPITFDINFKTKIEWFLKKSEILRWGCYLTTKLLLVNILKRRKSR
jgi:Fe-S-cluster containining protein